MNVKNTRILCFLVGLGVALSPGCRFGQLKNDLTDLKSLATLRGTVTSAETEPAPIVVALIKEEGDLRRVADYRILREPGEFELTVLPGSYFLGAFRDSQQNLRLDDDEWIAIYGDPTLFDVTAGATLIDLDMHLDSKLEGRLEDYIGAYKRELPVFKSHVGEVATLDAERFAPEHAADGLWNPVDFLFDIGGGVFFAEPYDPARIPVLFVHGASGTPRDFTPLVSGLDRERYQAWYFYYPSGMRLGRLGPFLHEMVEELQGSIGFDQLFVVAHSMGGLVCRSYFNTYSADLSAPGYLQRFVSISTPWAGQKMATSGVKYAPRVVPSWRDMDPTSDFLAELLVPGLPAGVKHTLLFGYKGDRGDGTIKLNSQLAPRAQAGAVKVLGFEEDHMSILENDDVLAALHEALAAP